MLANFLVDPSEDPPPTCEPGEHTDCTIHRVGRAALAKTGGNLTELALTGFGLVLVGRILRVLRRRLALAS